MDRIRKLYQRFNYWNYNKLWGLRIRNRIERISLAVHPYVSILIPNFRVAHYVYIIGWCILGSILMYPVKNMHYIDVLFFSTGASTQAGLNTVDVNTITLYQQIIIYIIATFCTPIFIHGSILFFRLYSFERHFDNIKESSKLNSKMRRSATIAAANSHNDLDPTQVNTRVNQKLGKPNPHGLGSRRGSANLGLNTDYDMYAGTTMTDNHNTPSPTINFRITSEMNGNRNGAGKRTPLNIGSRYDRPSDPSDLAFVVPPPQHSSNDEVELEDPVSSPNEHEPHEADITRDYEGENIRFADLPQPKRRSVNPSDMLRSIAMNRAMNGGSPIEEDEDDEPALKIRLPTEIENDKGGHGGLFIAKMKKKRRRWTKSSRHSRPKNLRKKSFDYHSEVDIELIDSELPANDHEDGDDEAEDDEEHTRRPKNGRQGSTNTILKADDSDFELNNEDEDEGDIQRAQSNLAVPSKDETGGVKFHKRSNTLDIPHGKHATFIKSPTIDKMMKKGRKLRPSITRIRSGLRPSVSNVLTTDEEYDSDASFDSEASDDDEMSPKLSRVVSGNYLSWIPTVGRNSTFVHLTAEQKEELGGVEYRAVKLLIKIVVIYYVGLHLIALILLIAWIHTHKEYNPQLAAQGISINWWAIFQSQSSFNDLGLTLTNNSLYMFSRDVYVMIVVSFFVVIGNTGFPIFLRFIIWILFKFAKDLSLYKESLGFLLDHPRRCFTLLFPSVPTWWLFFILIVLNGVDLVLFIILDLNNDYLTQIPIGFRIMDGLFQAFSTRTAGFSVLDLSELHPAVQVSYMLMMYISVLPLAISIRRTNVYEEQSLGVYLRGEENQEAEENGDIEKTPQSFIGAHLRNQLSFDLWFIFLALFIICIAEGGKLNEDSNSFTVFKVLFEIISAYGTVGLLLGYPGINASFSAEFTTISKLVIVALMIRGRHRGLPYSLDRAIMLPDDKMDRRDRLQENHAIRRNATGMSEEDGGVLGPALTRRMSQMPLIGERFRRRSNRNLKPRATRTFESHEMEHLNHEGQV